MPESEPSSAAHPSAFWSPVFEAASRRLRNSHPRAAEAAHRHASLLAKAKSFDDEQARSMLRNLLVRNFVPADVAEEAAESAETAARTTPITSEGALRTALESARGKVEETVRQRDAAQAERESAATELAAARERLAELEHESHLLKTEIGVEKGRAARAEEEAGYQRERNKQLNAAKAKADQDAAALRKKVTELEERLEGVDIAKKVVDMLVKTRQAKTPQEAQAILLAPIQESEESRKETAKLKERLAAQKAQLEAERVHQATERSRLAGLAELLDGRKAQADAALAAANARAQLAEAALARARQAAPAPVEGKEERPAPSRAKGLADEADLRKAAAAALAAEPAGSGGYLPGVERARRVRSARSKLLAASETLVSAGLLESAWKPKSAAEVLSSTLDEELAQAAGALAPGSSGEGFFAALADWSEESDAQSVCLAAQAVISGVALAVRGKFVSSTRTPNETCSGHYGNELSGSLNASLRHDSTPTRRLLALGSMDPVSLLREQVSSGGDASCPASENLVRAFGEKSADSFPEVLFMAAEKLSSRENGLGDIGRALRDALGSGEVKSLLAKFHDASSYARAAALERVESERA